LPNNGRQITFLSSPRFRDTFLSLGGGIPAGEVFRKFRGRDPDQEAYIEYYKSQSWSGSFQAEMTVVFV